MPPSDDRSGLWRLERLPGAYLEARPRRARRRHRPAGHGLSLPARHEQVEPDRPPPLRLLLDGLAGTSLTASARPARRVELRHPPHETARSTSQRARRGLLRGDQRLGPPAARRGPAPAGDAQRRQGMFAGRVHPRLASGCGRGGFRLSGSSCRIQLCSTMPPPRLPLRWPNRWCRLVAGTTGRGCPARSQPVTGSGPSGTGAGRSRVLSISRRRPSADESMSRCITSRTWYAISPEARWGWSPAIARAMSATP